MKLLNAPHVAPLTSYVEKWRRLRGGGDSIPYFDPSEAGIHARILLLLEAPGARAVDSNGLRFATGSGFVSADNDDQTAANTWCLLNEAGVNRRAHLATWNAVPWYLGDSRRIRAADLADIDEARPAIEELIGLLPELRVVVLLGRRAERAWTRAGKTELPYISAPHPSPRNLNGRPESRELIRNALTDAAAIANQD